MLMFNAKKKKKPTGGELLRTEDLYKQKVMLLCDCVCHSCPVASKFGASTILKRSPRF